MASKSMRSSRSTSETPPTAGAGPEGGVQQPYGNAAAAEHLAAAEEPGGILAKLHLYVDLESREISMSSPLEAKKSLERGAVGHTWVALEYPDVSQVPDDVHASHKPYLEQGGKYADPMGFWPGRGGYETNPFFSYVSGRVKQPDTSHEGMEKASQTFDLTNDEVSSVIDYAESKRGAKYSVYGYNCTSFAKESIEAAGKSAPSMTTFGIAMPNAVYEGIKAQQAEGTEGTMVDDLEGINFDELYEDRYGIPRGQNPDHDPQTEDREAEGHLTRT